MNVRTTGALISVALGCVLALFFVFSRSAAVEAAYPIERAKSLFVRCVWARVVGAWRGSAAQAENLRLRRELAAVSLLGGDLERLEAENARLRKALGYASRTAAQWLPAAVLSRDGGATAARETMRVDKGSLDGVRVGAAVTVPEGLVGRVASVTPHTAVVALLSDPSVKVSCEIETGAANPPRGILAGGEETQLVLKHLVRSDGILPRSRVITSGLGGVFPRGIEVGTYLSDGNVLPSVDPSAVEDVFIRREK